MGDLCAIPSGLVALDPVTQDELQAAMFQQFHTQADHDTELAYTNLHTAPVALSALRDAYNAQSHLTPLKTMNTKAKLSIDNDMIHLPTVDRLLWKTNTHYLDYLLAVASKAGLWPTIPNVAHDHNFLIQINLNRRYQQFRGKHGRLGFDPAQSMLYFGKCRNDDVWLGLAPKDIITGGCEPIAAGTCSGPTPLPMRRWRMIIDFLASCLATIPGKSYSLFRPYQVPLEDASVTWSRYTNVM